MWFPNRVGCVTYRNFCNFSLGIELPYNHTSPAILIFREGNPFAEDPSNYVILQLTEHGSPSDCPGRGVCKKRIGAVGHSVVSRRDSNLFEDRLDFSAEGGEELLSIACVIFNVR